ncbi:ribonuclease domain-containing protein [Streptomyces albogriseolus]|uniref:ribonuclease domain-containing protein n=1 Tax=Streptomyces albogriseolus TaxID=1887 RepID=UPI0036F6A596
MTPPRARLPRLVACPLLALRAGCSSGGEGVLPRRERGRYRAGTVPTPGPDDRGARRVVTGRNGGTYRTDDPYASFTAVPR